MSGLGDLLSGAVQPGRLDEVTRALTLTPQEQFLYQHHLNNLTGPGGVDQPDGSRSTVLQMSVTGPDGLTYNVPTVWDGQALPANQAMDRVRAIGLDHFPGYADEATAEARYQQMHQFMDEDVRRRR